MAEDAAVRDFLSALIWSQGMSGILQNIRSRLRLNMKILLITGWGLGTAVLDAFSEQLRYQHEVEVWDIFDPADEAIFNRKTEDARQFDVLMGWSLGGQLALVLAQEIARRTQQAKPVIACMSNPCFVARDNWSAAMPLEQFDQFATSAKQDTASTIKRFCALVTWGSVAPRTRAKQLQRQVLGVDLEYQKKHLYLLAELDLRDLVNAYQGRMLFIIASEDALVSSDIRYESALVSNTNVRIEKINGGHDAILFDVPRVIEPVLHFLISSESAT